MTDLMTNSLSTISNEKTFLQDLCNFEENASELQKHLEEMSQIIVWCLSSEPPSLKG